jgi:hypothetical protein
MNIDQIKDFTMRYLETTGCRIIEKSPAHVTVKLSPEADRELTNRSYYWNFVERTGAEPETMSFTFVFDRDRYEQLTDAGADGAPAGANGSSLDSGTSILGRYFGFTPTSVSGRVLLEDMHFGSRRLEQIFQATKNRGKFVNLYEQPKETTTYQNPIAYTSWLGVNFKVELTCDMKRNEIQSLGICLSTGEIVTKFHERMIGRELTPKLPANTHVRRTISLERAVHDLERYVESTVRQYDHAWAVHARERLNEELARIKNYYEDLLRAADESEKPQFDEQYEHRRREIEWQYEPRVQVSVINCGIFHLASDTFS